MCEWARGGPSSLVASQLLTTKDSLAESLATYSPAWLDLGPWAPATGEGQAGEIAPDLIWSPQLCSTRPRHSL